ncbi:hypothetical protein C2845_PM04G13040 [Panicum miliaceum]|uniref:Uncharacterized protein n=1 Tax=Panicum miliaceum TaxID=4540 RepID=A0A3L6QUF6_PANMI|nr:hypothetical protein C2845_PM04G13040 [Panicum miliaceum]
MARAGRLDSVHDASCAEAQACLTALTAISAQVPLPTYRQLPCGEADSAKRDIATLAYGEDKQLSAGCSPRYVI